MLSSAEQDVENNELKTGDSEDNLDIPRHEPDEKLADIRLYFGRYFLVLIAGKERRDKDRLAAERKARPVFMLKNMPLLLLIWGSLIFTFYSIVSFALRAAISSI